MTVYAILPGRGYEQSALILGAAYEGFLIHDGWTPYYRFRFAFHQSCLAYLLKRCREMEQIGSPAARAFPRAVGHLLQTGWSCATAVAEARSPSTASGPQPASWRQNWIGN